MLSYVRGRLNRIDNHYSRILHISLDAFGYVFTRSLLQSCTFDFPTHCFIVRIEGTKIEQI
jgi:hypothetical protein